MPPVRAVSERLRLRYCCGVTIGPHHAGEDGGHLRVSDEDRDRVVDQLAQAATDGRLTVEEYSERAEQALAARTRAELATVTADLGPTPQPGADGAAGAPAMGESMLAIFGSDTRRGKWAVPGEMRARSVFGSCEIDMRHALLQQRVTTINAVVVFGSLEVVVPEGVEVQLRGTAIFGSKESRAPATAPPGAPVLVINAMAVFGSVEVRQPGGLKDAIRQRLEGWK